MLNTHFSFGWFFKVSGSSSSSRLNPIMKRTINKGWRVSSIILSSGSQWSADAISPYRGTNFGWWCFRKWWNQLLLTVKYSFAADGLVRSSPPLPFSEIPAAPPRDARVSCKRPELSEFLWWSGGVTWLLPRQRAQPASNMAVDVCFFIKILWCSAAVVRDKLHDSVDVSLCPFFLPGNFHSSSPSWSTFIQTPTPPQRLSTSTALIKLQPLSPNAPRLIIGDVNQPSCCLQHTPAIREGHQKLQQTEESIQTLQGCLEWMADTEAITEGGVVLHQRSHPQLWISVFLYSNCSKSGEEKKLYQQEKRLYILRWKYDRGTTAPYFTGGGLLYSITKWAPWLDHWVVSDPLQSCLNSTRLSHWPLFCRKLNRTMSAVWKNLAELILNNSIWTALHNLKLSNARLQLVKF